MQMKRFMRLAENGLATIIDLGAERPTVSQTELAVRLTNDLNALLSGPDKGQGSAFWQGICKELHSLASTADPMYFMRWPPIAATMVHGSGPLTFRMWWMLRRSPEWRSKWKPALQHPQYGHPPPFGAMLSTNAMAIEHAFHLFRFQQQQGRYLHEADCIIEFGGGFGSMCRLSRAMGFRGKYIIFDLPPILALQRYYLGLHGIEADSNGAADVWLCSDLDSIMAALNRDAPRQISLMSTWALSEMPMAVRHSIEPFFSHVSATKALLAYQTSFEGNDNCRYFHELMARTGDLWSWTELPVDPSEKPLTPDDSLYVFGERNKNPSRADAFP